MSEQYENFLERINTFEKPELLINDQVLVPTQSILDKVKEDNSFNDFFGDTVVFDLDREIKDRVFLFIEMLYQFVPDCFCEKIKKETLHVTLHDLSNSTERKKVMWVMKENEENLRHIRDIMPKKSIKMVTHYLVNMVDTSLVLAVNPQSKEDYNNLMKCYEVVDSVYKLGYKFTPHITLGYYNRNGFDSEKVKKLKEVAKALNQLRFEFSLKPNNLVYQHFSNMNSYQNVFYFMQKK